mgnify:CR=1 FL=1
MVLLRHFCRTQRKKALKIRPYCHFERQRQIFKIRFLCNFTPPLQKEGLRGFIFSNADQSALKCPSKYGTKMATALSIIRGNKSNCLPIEVHRRRIITSAIMISRAAPAKSIVPTATKTKYRQSISLKPCDYLVLKHPSSYDLFNHILSKSICGNNISKTNINGAYHIIRKE